MTTETEAAGRLPSEIANEVVLKFFEDKMAFHQENPLCDEIKHHDGTRGWLSTLAANWNNELGGIYLNGKLSVTDEEIRQRRRELDPTPVDEAFAELVSTSRKDLPWSALTHWMIDGGLSIKKDHATFILAHKNRDLIDNPTIGDFYTACRLFGITDTPTGGACQQQ